MQGKYQLVAFFFFSFQSTMVDDIYRNGMFVWIKPRKLTRLLRLATEN